MSRHSQDQFYQKLSIKAGFDENLVNLLEYSREQSASINKSEISLSWGEAWMMAYSLKSLRPQKILEVGTLTGFSALFLTYALRAEGGEVWTVEKDPVHFNKAKEVFLKWGVGDEKSSSYWIFKKGNQLIHLILGDGKEVMKTLSPSWDGVFIDANKSGSTDYAMIAFELLRVGGALIVDNSFGRGALWDESVHTKSHRVLVELSDFLSNRAKFNSCLWPTSDGMWWAVKK